MFSRNIPSRVFTPQKLTSIATKGVQTPFRSISAKEKKAHPFMQFFKSATYFRTGRSWSVSELRIKSNEDLEKLWFVLLKERNSLATFELYCRQQRKPMHNKERIFKCKQSMAAIKQVVSERKIALKTAYNDKEFLAKQSKKTKQRRLERYADKMENITFNTPNQHKFIPIQCKTWRRKTLGKGLIKKPTIVAH